MKIKPILFNTEMIRAILEDRKTMTRRVVKPQPPSQTHPQLFVTPPYSPGDILYVRETWTVWNGKYEYKADVADGYGPFCTSCIEDICTGNCNSILKWRPSIHMPREATRIFLRVTGVRVDRLNNITPQDIRNEGMEFDMEQEQPVASYKRFINLWDSTIKPADRTLYGWKANPWVWVIEFKIISKENVDDEQTD